MPVAWYSEGLSESMMRSLALAIALLSLGACASRQRTAPEKLYFALEVRQDGKLVGKPKLLGEAGRVVRVERRAPGAPEPDYRLVLTPSPEGEAFKIQLELRVPRAEGHGQLALLHGEERRLQLGQRPGDLEVKLLMMKVDSPEFRALMDLSGQGGKDAPISI